MKIKTIIFILIISLIGAFAIPNLNLSNSVKAETTITNQTTQNQPVKKLHKSTTDKKIAGVCGGLAEFFGIDSTWVRIGFVIGFVFFGVGLGLYIILWIIMP